MRYCLGEKEPNRIKVGLAKNPSSKFPNLVRYVPSGILFARVRVKGKLIRRSLKTKGFSVARLRLGDLEKEERQMAEHATAFAERRMTFADALQIYRQRLHGDASLKPHTKAHREERISVILKT